MKLYAPIRLISSISASKSVFLTLMLDQRNMAPGTLLSPQIFTSIKTGLTEKPKHFSNEMMMILA